jgi:hypothetical protein
VLSPGRRYPPIPVGGPVRVLPEPVVQDLRSAVGGSGFRRLGQIGLRRPRCCGCVVAVRTGPPQFGTAIMLPGDGWGGGPGRSRNVRRCDGLPSVAGAAVARHSVTGVGAWLRRVVPAVTEHTGSRWPTTCGGC